MSGLSPDRRAARDHAMKVGSSIQSRGGNAENIWIAEELAREVVTALTDLAENLKKRA